jgi:hypothetical protein
MGRKEWPQKIALSLQAALSFMKAGIHSFMKVVILSFAKVIILLFTKAIK